MGYSYFRLNNLPTHFDYYFFLTGERIRLNATAATDVLYDNFDKISCLIGDKAVLCTDNYKEVAQFLRERCRFYDLEEEDTLRFPCLIIMNKHPFRFKEEQSTEFFVISYDLLNEVYQDKTAELVLDICNLAIHDDRRIFLKVNRNKITSGLKRLRANSGIFFDFVDIMISIFKK